MVGVGPEQTSLAPEELGAVAIFVGLSANCDSVELRCRKNQQST